MVIVLDCNIWITLTINKQIDIVAELYDNGNILVSCNTLRNEILSVLQRPKLKKFISIIDIKKVIALHDLVTVNYEPGEILNVVNDIKDNYLFALSLKSNADFLVTGDKLLLEFDKYEITKVITLATFKKLI